MALTGFGSITQCQLAYAENVTRHNSVKPLSYEQRAGSNYDTYIIGPGDALGIELLDVPELSGNYSVGPDGNLYLPRLRALQVEGLTIEELRDFLTQQFSTYVRDPQVYIRPVSYRPIRIYVGGEVRRPGYYTLAGIRPTTRDTRAVAKGPWLNPSSADWRMESTRNNFDNESQSSMLLPTVFDAIRRAQGITPYTDLAQVQITRKRAEGLGGGRMRTNLNLLSLITEGDESQNIRLFDGDVVNVGRSPVVLHEQLLKAGQSNLNPQFIEVFVTGRINNPGGVQMPQGSSLNQAISLAGGTKFLKGRVEFIRFNREGRIDRRIFSYKPSAEADTPNNPILAAGDVIRIQDSLISGSVNVINELTTPFIGFYSFYSLFSEIAP